MPQCLSVVRRSLPAQASLVTSGSRPDREAPGHDAQDGRTERCDNEVSKAKGSETMTLLPVLVFFFSTIHHTIHCS